MKKLSILTILALLRWRLQKDQYPAALDELVAAGFLNELPMDPWSDKPLVYKKTDDDFRSVAMHNISCDLCYIADAPRFGPIMSFSQPWPLSGR